MGYGWHDNAMGSGWWVLMVAGKLLFLAVLVTGAVLLVRHYGPPAGEAGSSNSPIDILKLRFARGEISEEEYTRTSELLKGQA